MCCIFFYCRIKAKLFFFFFSSRRRHTRFDCDWSSDVCSSDLSKEAWKKQSATGYIMISAHDTGARPLFPNNNLHADVDAKVWAVRDCDADLAFRDKEKGLTLEEA